MSLNWYVVTKSSVVRKKPIRFWFEGKPLVLFRTHEGQVRALLDRCPHRGAPLSKGSVRNGCISCPYHGWQFDGDGNCQKVPGSENNDLCKPFKTEGYKCCEDQGLIWVQAKKNDTPTTPYRIPGFGESGFKTVSWQIEIQTSIEAAAENLLDATHTHYVHSGLIRTEGKRKSVVATVRSIQDGIEAEYHEGQQSGWIMKLLSGGSRNITSYGRFILPGIAQLEYRTDRGWCAYITAFLTPTKNGLTQAHLVFSYKWGWLCRWFSWLVKPLFWLALRQDVKILKWQSQNLKECENFSFVSTPLDLLGPKIHSLLKVAKTGQTLPQWKEKKTELFL